VCDKSPALGGAFLCSDTRSRRGGGASRLKFLVTGGAGGQREPYRPAGARLRERRRRHHGATVEGACPSAELIEPSALALLAAVRDHFQQAHVSDLKKQKPRRERVYARP